MDRCMSAKPRLCLTTPVTRPQNLPLMEADKELRAAPDFFDIRWLIIPDLYSMEQMGVKFDGYLPSLPWAEVRESRFERPGRRFGEENYNFLADAEPPVGLWPDEWWMGIADDSLPVPGIFEAFRKQVDLGADVVVFPMFIPGVVHCLARPEDIRPSHMSGGQVFHRRGVMGPTRWRSGDATLDGIFVKELWETTHGIARWRFATDGPTIQHNQLRNMAVPGGIER